MEVVLELVDNKDTLEVEPEIDEHHQMNWPEAAERIVSWICLGFIVFCFCKCMNGSI